MVIDNALTVASCTGCGTITPPVNFTQSAASTTLTVENLGAGLAAHFTNGNVVIDNNLTVASCTGCGTITPPVTWNISNVNPVLTVNNSGTGLNSDGIRVSANGPGFAINVVGGDSTTAGSWKFTSAGSIIISGSGGINVQGGGSIDVNTGNLSVLNGDLLIGQTLQWDIKPAYIAPGTSSNKLDFLDTGGTSRFKIDVAANLISFGLPLDTITVVNPATFNGGTTFNGAVATFNSAANFTSTLSAVSVAASAVLATGDIATSTGVIGAYGGEVDIRGIPASFRGTDILNKNGVVIRELWYTGTDNSSQPGSNVGADYIIQRWNDGGTIIDSPLKITRSSGLVTLADDATVVGTLTVGACIGCASGLTPPVTLTATNASFILSLTQNGNGNALNAAATGNGHAGSFQSSGPTSTILASNSGSGEGLSAGSASGLAGSLQADGQMLRSTMR